MGKVMKFNRLGTKPDLDRMSRIMEPNVYPERELNEDRMNTYKRMIVIAQKFEDNGFWTVNFDDPEIKTNSHMIRAKFIEDDYEDDEAKDFAEILRLSDGFMFFGDCDGNISIVIQIEGVYVDLPQGK